MKDQSAEEVNGLKTGAGKPGKRLLYLASEGWFFKSHFLHIARKAQAAGYIAALTADLTPGLLADTGLTLFPAPSPRKIRSLFPYLQSLRQMLRLKREFASDLVHVIW